MTINLAQIKDNRTMLLESYVCTRRTYIDMLSFRELGDICPDIAAAIENVGNIMSALRQYLGNAAINEYNIQKRDRDRAEERDYIEQRKQAVLVFQQKRNKQSKKGGTL